MMKPQSRIKANWIVGLTFHAARQLIGHFITSYEVKLDNLNAIWYTVFIV